MVLAKSQYNPLLSLRCLVQNLPGLTETQLKNTDISSSTPVIFKLFFVAQSTPKGKPNFQSALVVISVIGSSFDWNARGRHFDSSFAAAGPSMCIIPSISIPYLNLTNGESIWIHCSRLLRSPYICAAQQFKN